MSILYYLVLLPLSFLPTPVLYGLSNVLYAVIYSLHGYRREVVRTNLKNSFPEFSASELRVVERQFYHHFCDLLVESIKGFSITPTELNKRFQHRNKEIFDKFFQLGRPVTLVGGHSGNWEWLALSAALHLPHQPLAIYTPLQNAFMNDKILKSRSRFGLMMRSYAEVKQLLDSGLAKPALVIFGADQSPTLSQQPYWTTFLNQETGVQFGVEKFAVQYDAPVVYGFIHRLARGHYEIEYRLICENPRELPYGEITEAHTRMLESDIRKAPFNWLWTHKRWKRKKADYENHQAKQ